MSENATARQAQTSWSKTLLSLWSLRRVNTVPSASPLPSLGALVVLWLGLWTALDWWQRQPEPAFVIDGAPLLAWYVLALLGLAALLRARSHPTPPWSATLLLVTGLVPVPLLLMAVVGVLAAPVWFWCSAVIVAMYGLLYLGRGLRMLTGESQRIAAALGVVFIGGFIVLSDAVNAIPDLWNPLDTDSAAADQNIEQQEVALFEQSDRIDKALMSVRRESSLRAQGFFVGFAGVGDQKVFAQEIGLAARVIGERFGTIDRQISLINDERDLDRAPLASVSGLDYALQGIAAHMKLDRDVLFLAISSHGSMDGIAVENSHFPLIDLAPDVLAQALHDAGIEWRVIVISACYAGIFIDPLRDARTVIITAAAADRTSFGCSNDRDLTYFGEAFFRDALPASKTLRDAFNKAKAAVAARERAEGETPSDPQAYFGAEIENHLAGISRTTASPAEEPGTESL